VFGLAPGDDRPDSQLPELAPVAVVVVAAVADELGGPSARPADEAAHGRDPVEERDQLGDVVAVAACEREGEWDPALVDDRVMFGAQPSAVNRARARLGVPLFACT
jgi:hypothetical protein